MHSYNELGKNICQRGGNKLDINEIGKLIGNTPMIKINCVHGGIKKSVYTKLEWYNFSGSIKDKKW